MKTPTNVLDLSFREKFVLGKDVTEDDLRVCAELFNNSYGTWSEQAKLVNPKLEAGSCIKMSVKLLRKQCVFDPENCYLARVYSGHDLCGYAFAASWTYPDQGVVCWVIQLVTDTNYRCLGVATRNLLQLRSNKFTIYGLVSSHIAACITLAKCCETLPIDRLDLDFVKQDAKNIIKFTTVQYLKTSVLHGSLFSDVNDGSTNFFADHQKVLGYLREYLEVGRYWPLGAPTEGHEYFIVVRAKHVYEQ